MKNTKNASAIMTFLIVIIIIIVLVIILYFVYNSYLINTRDSKRISDIHFLSSKIEAEYAKGVEYSDLQIYEKTNSGLLFNNEFNHFSEQGSINFQKINEISSQYKDPSNDYDYPFAYSIGKVGQSGNYKNYHFMQIGTINEKNNTAYVIGSYKQFNLNMDSLGIITNKDGNIITNGGVALPYSIN